MAIATKMETFIEGASWIRKMFEEGAVMKQKYGAENVFDFSLGNPNVDPPDSFYETLEDFAKQRGVQHHEYMPNPGYPTVRASLAEYLTPLLGAPFKTEHVIMTCGAAGALNIALKAVLNPGDEVISPKPFFPEYRFYVDNHNGVLKLAATKEDFALDVEAIEKELSPKTAAIIINSPNNPTGMIYSEQQLKALGEMLTQAEKKYGRSIYLIADEPYRNIVYDGAVVPSIFKVYRNSILGASFSKDLSLAGERIGYVVAHPEADDIKKLMDAMTLANRILGFVNAPALMQRVVGKLRGQCVDISKYKAKRDKLCAGLADAGYEFQIPEGAFYLFPKTPIADDVKFVDMLKEERILAVRGSGFGGPGHIRLSYCIPDWVIEKSIPGFKKAFQKASNPGAEKARRIIRFMSHVVIAMSGGVDSAVAAALLKERFDAVTAVHMLTGVFGADESNPSLRNVSAIAEALGLPLLFWDLSAEFKRDVTDYFVRSYANGETPNPCVICNPRIKFGVMLRRALDLDADAFATGHYARIRFADASSRYRLLKGADSSKDQSYFLSRLNQEQLSKTVFPLGDLLKSEVRTMAGERGLAGLVTPESQEFCFMGEKNYTEFLETSITPVPGDFVDTAGNPLGRHKGVHRYTIGQRRGLNLPSTEPYYVVGIDCAANRVILGRKNDLLAKEMLVRDINWIAETPHEAFDARVRIRFRHREAPATVRPLDQTTARVVFHEDVRAITPGQAAVFYDGPITLGGGWIEKTVRNFHDD